MKNFKLFNGVTVEGLAKGAAHGALENVAIILLVTAGVNIVKAIQEKRKGGETEEA